MEVKTGSKTAPRKRRRTMTVAEELQHRLDAALVLSSLATDIRLPCADNSDEISESSTSLPVSQSVEDDDCYAEEEKPANIDSGLLSSSTEAVDARKIVTEKMQLTHMQKSGLDRSHLPLKKRHALPREDVDSSTGDAAIKQEIPLTKIEVSSTTVEPEQRVSGRPICQSPPKKCRINASVAASQHTVASHNATAIRPSVVSAHQEFPKPEIKQEAIEKTVVPELSSTSFDPHLGRAILQAYPLILYPDPDGDLPLHISVVHGHYSVSERLVQLMRIANHPIDVFNKVRQTPLHLAVASGNIRLIRLLLAEGASPNLQDRKGDCCVHLAVKYENPAVFAALKNYTQHKLKLHTRNYKGLMPMHVAVLTNNQEMVEMLLANGADINCPDAQSGRTPLYYAAENNLLEMVRFLVSALAHVNQGSLSGVTPLLAASGRGNTEVVALLLKHGADMGTKGGSSEFSSGDKDKLKRRKTYGMVRLVDPSPHLSSTSGDFRSGPSTPSTPDEARIKPMLPPAQPVARHNIQSTMVRMESGSHSLTSSQMLPPSPDTTPVNTEPLYRRNPSKEEGTIVVNILPTKKPSEIPILQQHTVKNIRTSLDIPLLQLNPASAAAVRAMHVMPAQVSRASRSAVALSSTAARLQPPLPQSATALRHTAFSIGSLAAAAAQVRPAAACTTSATTSVAPPGLMYVQDLRLPVLTPVTLTQNNSSNNSTEQPIDMSVRRSEEGPIDLRIKPLPLIRTTAPIIASNPVDDVNKNAQKQPIVIGPLPATQTETKLGTLQSQVTQMIMQEVGKTSPPAIVLPRNSNSKSDFFIPTPSKMTKEIVSADTTTPFTEAQSDSASTTTENVFKAQINQLIEKEVKMTSEPVYHRADNKPDNLMHLVTPVATHNAPSAMCDSAKTKEETQSPDRILKSNTIGSMVQHIIETEVSNSQATDSRIEIKAEKCD